MKRKFTLKKASRRVFQPSLPTKTKAPIPSPKLPDKASRHAKAPGGAGAH